MRLESLFAYTRRADHTALLNIPPFLRRLKYQPSPSAHTVDPWNTQPPSSGKTVRNFWLPQNFSHPSVSTGGWSHDPSRIPKSTHTQVSCVKRRRTRHKSAASTCRFPTKDQKYCFSLQLIGSTDVKHRDMESQLYIYWKKNMSRSGPCGLNLCCSRVDCIRFSCTWIYRFC